MKNLKKVLAMVLAFACTFTMFASAKMYEDVQPGTEFSEAITMLSDLGIIQGKTDNKYHPEDTITRAEACALIARLMTGDPNAAGFNNAHHFKDVPAGFWASSAIGYCVVNGIAIGVDQAGTRFEPQRPIKDKEFVTMIVRALGYETPDMRNNFPFGYMSAANAIGLLQGVNMVPDTDALRGEDAQVIYNAMFVDYARGAKRVNVAHGTTVESYPTLAEDVWHLDRAAVGTWNKHDKDDEDVTLSNCKAHTWVIVGKDDDENILAYPIEDGNTDKDSRDIYESLEKKDKNDVKAAAYKFKYEGTGDIEALRGYKVELWGSGKHGEATWDKGEGKYVFSNDWKIKAIKTIAGQTKFDYDASKADSKRDDGEIKVDEETTLKLENASKNAQKVSEKNTSKTDRTTYISKEEYNREKAKDDEKLEAALNVRDGAKYRLMDWDGDKEIDWVVVDEASYYKVESVSSKRLTVTSMVDTTKNKKNEEEETESLTQTWKLDDDNEIFTDKDKKNSYKITYKAPEGLKEGDIIEVAYSTGYDEITGTISVVEPENHKLDKVATKNHLTLTFDGQVTELAQNKNEADTIVPTNPTKYINFDEEELGTEFAVAKNRNGFIIHSDYATDSANYLMVLDTDDGKNSVRGELGAMKIITADNKVESNIEVVSDLRIDGKTTGNGYDKDSRHFDESQIVGNVYKYWKDADGKITKLESMVSTSNGEKANEYEYVAKNDRLTLRDNNQSYALKDAKVIFAVKPHSNDSDYIQRDKDGTLKVDDADVLAVKQADIPDIGGKDDDTKIHTLDKNSNRKDSWVQSHLTTIAVDTNNNKDIKGAVLGVNNFNKFNAGSTKIGLVTNVSFDSNGVVSLEVATNGKTDAVSSAEKVKFEDIVSVKDYKNDSTESVGSRTETINVGIMKGKSLKDYLYKNGAYAEITTDADGKLTGVLFMDEKNKDDGIDPDLNAGNAVIGNYYQVSRKVIADVKDGNWLSVIKGSAVYADEDNFRSLDSKNTQKASNFASDAAYYVIDGAPTRKDKDYNDTKASILEGFDGTPDVKAGEAADVVASEINNSTLSDRYNVADVATKIDKDGAGDVVAVYAYKNDMDEAEAINMASVVVTDNNQNVVNTVKPGDEITITASVTLNHNLNKLDRVKVFKNGKEVAEIQATHDKGSNTIKVTPYTVPQTASGEYIIKGAYGSTVFGGGTKITVDVGTSKFVASELKLADKTTGTLNDNNQFQPVGKNGFYVFVGGELQQTRTTSAKTPVTGLTADDFKVVVNYTEREIAQVVEENKGYYYIELKNVDFTPGTGAEAGKNIAISLRGDKTAAGMQDLTVIANAGVTAQGGTVDSTVGTEDKVTNVGQVVSTGNDFNAVDEISSVKVKVMTADNRPVINLENPKENFTVKIDNVATTDFTVQKDPQTNGVYTITKTTSDTDLRGKTVEVIVNQKSVKIVVPAPKAQITLAQETLTAKVKEVASASSNITLKNAQKADLKIWLKESGSFDTAQTEATDTKTNLKATLNTSADPATVTLSETPTTAGTVEFCVGISTTDYAVLTVNIAEADAPTLADGLTGIKQTAGVAATSGTKAKYTANVTAHSAAENIQVSLKKEVSGQQEEIVKTDDVAITVSDNDKTAKAIADALSAKLTAASNTDYTVTNQAAKIVVEAKTAAAEKLVIEIASASPNTKVEKDTTGGACVDGVAGGTATKGTLIFTIPVAATQADEGEWTLTINETSPTAKVTVALRDGDNATKIAEEIVKKVKAATSSLNLTATNNGAEVTITETDGHEAGTFKDTVVTDVKFEKA